MVFFMLTIFKAWFNRYLSDQQSVFLLLCCFGFLAFFHYWGQMLAPVIASIVLAYLLDGAVLFLQRMRVSRWLAVMTVFVMVISLVLALFVVVFPLLLRQLANLATEMPLVWQHFQQWFQQLIANHADMISSQQVQSIVNDLSASFAQAGKSILSFSLSTIPSAIGLLVYAVLVPIMVLFMLQDSVKIRRYFHHFLPERHSQLTVIWQTLMKQLSAYVRGRVVEIVIVSVVSMAGFALLGLRYSVLLGVCVGLSVIVPYVGAVAVTIPIVLIALFQWGVSTHFLYLLILYGCIIILDANVLVPLLFSNALSLHPLAIIIAVLFFGGVWGFWGVFFAIPLATMVKVLMTDWPTKGL